MTLTDRVVKLEELMGEDPGEEFPGLVPMTLENAERITDLHQNLTESRSDLEGRLDAQRVTQSNLLEELATKVQALEGVAAKVSALEEELAFVKRSFSRQHLAEETPLQKVRVPEPKQFNGIRNAKELENFVWDMEQYFKAAKIPDLEQVNLASMFLAGDAKLWWRTKVTDDHNAGRPKITDWEMMKRELKEQFLPHNTSWVARESLKKLRQTGSVRDYVKEFSSLLLDIHNMSEEDKLFNFMSGLQVWAQTELRR